MDILNLGCKIICKIVPNTSTRVKLQDFWFEKYMEYFEGVKGPWTWTDVEI